MAEAGEDYSSEDESDEPLLDSDTDEASDADEFDGELQLGDDGEKLDEVDEIVIGSDTETETPNMEDTEPEQQTKEKTETGDQTEKKPGKRVLNIPKFMFFVNEIFYREGVRPRHVNILTDFADAEIFMIDGDSLLLELLVEQSLDWSNGGQFLHLTYLLERFLQYFTDKGGVFHLVFFQDMEIIWTSRPSMLLARQAIILHLQHNTSFTVITSINNFWGKEWKEHIDDKIPAFLLLTDAENIPWENSRRKTRELQFFFRSLLLHSLGFGLNCVFIAGVEMTATKVMGYYIESAHKMYYRQVQKPLSETWDFLINCFRKEASEVGLDYSLDFPSSQIDVKEKVKNAFQSPPQGGCRELVTLLACEMILCTVLNKLTNESSDFKEKTMESTSDRIKLFLLHSVLLKKLPLKYRAHTINANLLDQFCKQEDGEVYPFREIHKCLLEVLKVIQCEYPSMKAGGHSLDMTSVADLMDGRLVHTLFSLALDQRSMDLEAFSLPEDVIEELESLWSKVVAAVNTTEHSVVLRSHFFPIFAGSMTSFPRKEGESPTPETCVRLRQLLDVEHVLVNEYAGDIRSKINAMAEFESGEENLLNNGREFDERYHWHSMKPLSDDYDKAKKLITEKAPEDFRQRRRFFKDKQKFSRFHRMYGNSLTGGVDQAKIITLTDSNPKKKKQENKKGKVSKKAAKIIEENEQKRRDQEQQKDKEKWSCILVEIDKTLKKNNYSDAFQLVDKFLSDCKSSVFRLQALMKKAQCSLDGWQDMRFQDAQFSDMKYPVLVMECVQKIVHGFNTVVTEKDKKKLAVFTQKLGFDDISATFYDLSQEKKEKKAGQLSVHTTSARFQLEHMGHLLKRDDRTDPDPRVDPKHFIPDTWQRELLDAVDHNESALIVAPTSSGKTYASYYCMEKVLRDSDDGIVVYVSPTKALVNQVAATIYARFHRKQLPAGRTVYGVFTRDYQYNTLNSQILITVPQCLEILFLSPRGQGWTKNIKYVIFDEVHCLGQEIGAEVWEHLLLLIRCPFLALSATVGNPDHLFNWLQASQNFRRKQDKQDNIEQKKSYRVRLVVCEERYSDLEKSIYLPSPSNGRISKETGKCVDYNVTSTEEFVRLHPCAQLVTKQLRENGFPGDMGLTPREALELYDVMVQHWPEKESLQRLSPERYFKENAFVDKRHAREYENELKEEFKSWADDNQLEKVLLVIQSLNSICLAKMTSIEVEWSKLRMPSSGQGFILRNFSKLVEQLRAQDKLPAIVFSYDRKLCQHLAYGITRDFEKREEAVREGTRKRDEKRRLQHEKKVKRTRDEKLIGKRTNSQRDKLEDEQEEEDFSHLNEPLPECTLTFTHSIGNQGLKNIMDRIWMIGSQDPFKRGLKRGVSFHHAGLNNKMRSVVEMLFREKYLQVVTATGTLALGIHMPCKTVVFAGDSPFLNSLQYRQMSGRAGRRGFDPVGNVVFFGVPYRKVQRLMTANIPNLVGNFPINVTFVLRLLLLTSKGNDKKDAFTKSLALLSHPFICQKYPEMENQIKKHFLFSVELLARLSLINKDSGAPQEMAGLAVHLHYHEPSNFVLVSFLQRGLFHKLCQPGSDGKFPEDVMRKMVLVLSHLFKRVYLPANYKRSIDECPTSKVILDDLPDDFAEALQSYNEQVTKVFSQYLTTVAAEHEKERGGENKLPLSEIVFPNHTIEGEGTIKSLGHFAIDYSACSSFTALSGNSDLQFYSRNQTEENEDVEEEEESTEGETASSLESTESGKTSEEDDDLESEEDEKEFNREPIDHLLKIIRQDVYTDMNVVPILPLKKRDSTGRIHRLNAYTLDFFKHGSARVIEEENRIHSGEVFHSLKDFYLNIKTISCSLEELGPEDDNVVLAFKQLAQEYGEKFNKQFGRDI